MFRSFLQAIFGFDSPKVLTFTEHLAKYDIIRAKNECGENRYIAVSKDDRDIDILITKCKRLLSFVESNGLESKYAAVLAAFGRQIEQCAEVGGDVDPLFNNYDRIKRRIMYHSTSIERNLSGWESGYNR